MRSQLLPPLARSFPLAKWALAAAALFGLIHGSTYLDESADLATAVGIVDFIALAVGPWIAIGLCQLMAQGYAVWIKAIVDRVEMIQAGYPATESFEEPAHGNPPQVGFAARAVGYSFYVTAFALGAALTGVLMAAMRSQIEGLDYGYYPIVIGAHVAILAGTVITQCAYFAAVHGRVAAMERGVQQNGAVDCPSSPAIGPQFLRNSFERTEHWGRRLIGIRHLSAE